MKIARGVMGPAATTARTTVLGALAKNNRESANLARLRMVDSVTPVTPEEGALCTRTSEAADQFEALLSTARQEAEYRYQIVQARVRVAAALENPRATLIGDARYVVESYAQEVYLTDFNFLWPRLLVAIRAEKADDPVLTAIENARAQSDFAVLSLVLAASVPAVWLPALLAYGVQAWLFFAIGAATPLALRFFYELVFENQLAFGDVVKSTIDRSRLSVLKMLNLPQPTSRSEERALWERIRLAEADGRTADLVYLPAKAI